MAAMDPLVLQSALDSGMTVEDIRKMAAVLKQPAGRLTEQKVSKSMAARKGQVEEEIDQHGKDAADASVALDPMKMLDRFTMVMEQIAGSKKQSEDPLERALQNIGGSGSSTSSVGADSSTGNYTRSLAIARTQLLKAKSDPEKSEVINAAIWKNILKDYPEMDQAAFTPELRRPIVRHWLENKSQVRHHEPTQYWLQMAATVADACTRSQSEGLAAALLMLAAGEQCSIDHGNWMLAWGNFLEEGHPPFQNMSSRGVQVHPGEVQATRLVDRKWLEVIQSHLKEVDSFQEARKRLMKAPPPKNPKDPKAKGKGKHRETEEEGG